MLLPSFLLIGAILILYFGAEFSLDASEKVGGKLGLSPLVVGMLLIGFGTSLPEFFVGHIAGVQNKVGIAVGSLVGSNIANMFLILGISGLVAKLELSGKGILKQLGVHLVLAFVLIWVLFQPVHNIYTGFPLLAVCGVYLYFIFLDMKSEKNEAVDTHEEFKPAVVFVKLIAGFAMLYLGGELLVRSGTDLCLALGISEYIVSAIFIAFGTSFPELVTALLAAFKKKDTDLIVGNIIGSNLFNCAFILGSLGIYNFKMEGTYFVEMGLLVFGAMFLLALSYLKKSFYRMSGLIFLIGYAGAVGHWLKLF